jgi:hypothetical protein
MIPYTPLDEQKLKKQIEELFSMKLIEPSQSHYCCFAFIVRNHVEMVRGKARMVVNYRPLNATTKYFHYALPRQEVIM